MTKYIYLSLFLSMRFFLSAQSGTDSTEAVIITSKFATPKKNVPNQVLKINAQQITMSNSSTTADLLQNSGQVLVQRSQTGGGSPILRGFEANRVLIVVDNVRMNNAIFRAGHLQNALRVDGNSLQQAEVLFGAGSLLYGSDALGGVMHFRMKQAQVQALEAGQKCKVTGNAQIRFASVNKEVMNHFDVNFSGKKWAALTSFTVSDYGDLRQGKEANSYNKNYPNQFYQQFHVKRFNDRDSMVKSTITNNPVQKGTAFRQYNWIQKFVFQQKPGLTHRLNFYGTTTSAQVNRYDRLTEMNGSKPKYAEWYYGPEKWGMVNYQLELSKETKLYDNLMFTAAGQHFEESRISRRFNSANKKNQIEKVNALSFNLDARKNKGNTTFQYGLEGIFNKATSTAFTRNISTLAETPADTRYPDGGSKMQWFSAYLTAQVHLGSHFLLQAGGRASYNSLHSSFKNKDFFPFPYDEANQKSMGLVGNAGISYIHPKNLRISLLYSSGYRVPNVDDMSKVFESAGGQLIVPNPNIKPEYTHNGEFSISKTFGNRVKFDANVYYTLLRNAITLGKTQFQGKDSVVYEGTASAVYTSINKDKAYIYGAFVGLQAEIVKHVWLTGTWNYTYGRIITDTTPTPLDHIPPMFGRVGLSYNHPKCQLDFYTVFNGWKFKSQYNLNGEDNFVYATPEGTPAWYTLNLKVAVPVNKNFVIMSGMENIMDTNYRGFSSGVSAPGRNMYISFRAMF